MSGDMLFKNGTMIIACPACTTRYVVPDSAIGIDGRTVRCAKCRHSWFQDGPALELAEPAPAAPSPPPSAPPSALAPSESAPAEAPAAPWAEPAAHQPIVEPAIARAEAEPRIEQPAEPDYRQVEPPPPTVEEPAPGPDYADEGSWQGYGEAQSSFAHEPPFRPRRNRLKLFTWGAGVFAAVSVAAIGLVSWYGLPDWMPLSRPTFAEAQPGLVLDFPPNRQDRRTLPNGSELFAASGTVSNVGRTRRSVPTILIVLRDSRERIVYSWEVAPPKRQLAPGESVTINEAVTDVPRSAAIAEIGWKPG